MAEMTYEDLQVFNDINNKLAKKGFKSRLAYIYVSGFKDTTVTEWEWETIIPEEGAQPSIIVSEAVRELFS